MEENIRHIKILFLEDNPDDVELELYQLRNNNFEVEHDIARNKKEFMERLPDLQADIIIADYSLPDITGIEAIHILKVHLIDIPVILITGVGNEQIAVDSLREGATDYILKKNITGLSARINRALDVWADRKAVEKVREEKRNLQSQLFQSQKLESVGRLAGGIAHDFNNMLTAIMGYAGLSLKTLQENSPHHKNLKTITEVSKKAANLVQKLLLFSKKISLDLKPVDINALITNSTDFINRMLEESIEIKLDLQDDLPWVNSDEGQLTQVLINFAVNARDAMQGKGTFIIKTESFNGIENPIAQTPVQNIDEYILMTVSDTGCGITEESISKIFDPFYTTKDVDKGTGLGLSIVYSIVAGHGGWIDVTSKVDSGTTFKIYLPNIASKDSSAHIAVLDSPLVASQLINKGKETILIAEDEEILRQYTIEMLTDIGYNVLTARDGVEALDLFKKSPESIDLILSDMVMPNKTGLELFRDVKTIKPDVKFILVSGYCMEQIDGGILRDMQAILLKPYTTEKISNLIRNVLDEVPN